ncbi:DUF2076 domain-containing protein [Frateuria aurantia]
MNPQEQQLIEDFLNRLAASPVSARDPQASALIQQHLAGVQDPGYLLVQRGILLEQALKSAQAQISQLQAALQGQGPQGGSFLGGATGGYADAAVPPPPPGAYQNPPSWRERLFGGGAPTPPPPPAPQAAQPSFLGSAARTAAGVAGGMFLAEGLQDLFSGHHDSGGGFFGGGNTPDVVENVTNIYQQTPDQNFGGDDGGFVDNTDFDDSDSDNWS